jgi:hypothetical protein
MPAVTGAHPVHTFEPEYIYSNLNTVLVQVTAMVTEHGTTSYLCLFAREGAVVIVVGSPPMKEGQVLLQATHIQVMYLSVDQLDQTVADACQNRAQDGVGEVQACGLQGGQAMQGHAGAVQGGELQGTLIHALNLASSRFGLQRVRRRTSRAAS